MISLYFAAIPGHFLNCRVAEGAMPTKSPEKTLLNESETNHQQPNGLPRPSIFSLASIILT